jgi:hypothetical protein
MVMTESSSSSPEVSSEKIVQVIRLTLSATLGEFSSRAITFYADPQIAIRSPDQYETTLESILGDGTKLLIRSITEALYQKAGMEPIAGATLKDCIEAMRESSD